MPVANFGKAAGKTLLTGVGKGREASASAHTHLWLALLLAPLSSLMLKRSSTGRGEAAFCRACAASELTKILKSDYCVIFISHPHAVSFL